MITNAEKWEIMTSKKAYPAVVPMLMEPYHSSMDVRNRYHIMRRSLKNPIFHPYYIEYARNKLEFFERLKLGHRRNCEWMGHRFYLLRSSSGLWHRYPPQTVLVIYSCHSVPMPPSYFLIIQKSTSWRLCGTLQLRATNDLCHFKCSNQLIPFSINEIIVLKQDKQYGSS